MFTRNVQMAKKAADAVDLVIGRNIRLHRTAARLSQTVLGDRIGVSFQQVQKYEKGVNRVGASRLTRIAAVLDIPIIRLFDGVPGNSSADRSNAGAAAKLIAKPHTLRLVNAFAEISSPALRQSIVRFVEQIIAGKHR
jgi:transcriptional regulator with XRE-family HTH domain